MAAGQPAKGSVRLKVDAIDTELDRAVPAGSRCIDRSGADPAGGVCFPQGQNRAILVNNCYPGVSRATISILCVHGVGPRSQSAKVSVRLKIKTIYAIDIGRASIGSEGADAAITVAARCRVGSGRNIDLRHGKLGRYSDPAATLIYDCLNRIGYAYLQPGELPCGIRADLSSSVQENIIYRGSRRR